MRDHALNRAWSKKLICLPGVSFFSYQGNFMYAGPMNTCPCLESVKTLITTGKWEGGGCECGKKLPLGHLLIAGAAGLLLAVLVGALVSRRR